MRTGTREEWLAARLELLDAEKELTRRSDELARQRQELPWLRIDKDYRFETDEGSASLADLFRGRSQLLVYHFMFGPGFTAGCPACSAIADGFNGFVVHLANHDVSLCAVSRAPLAKLQAYKQRMGWSFPWASSHDSDFNYDFQAAITEEQQQSGAVEYNFRTVDMRPSPDSDDGPDASPVGTDWATYSRQMPGMSAFALDDGVVYHTYSTYARGLDVLWGAYQWLDRAPLGRNESGFWMRRHDQRPQPHDGQPHRHVEGRLGGQDLLGADQHGDHGHPGDAHDPERHEHEHEPHAGAHATQPELQPRARRLVAAPSEVHLERRELVHAGGDGRRPGGHVPVWAVQGVDGHAHQRPQRQVQH